MLGVQHALSGGAVWLAATPALDAAYDLSPGSVFVGAWLTAGAAMLPDLDQRNSTIGRTYGPLTNVVARLLAAVAGGHRNGTHSLLAVLAFTGFAWFSASVGGWWQALVLWVLLGVALRAAGISVPGHRSLTSVLHAGFCALVTGAVLMSGVDLFVPLVAGVVLGVAAHIAGDMLTPQGCPLLWPFTKARHGVGLVTTGGWTSPALTGALTLAVVVLAAMLTPADAYVADLARLAVGAT